MDAITLRHSEPTLETQDKVRPVLYEHPSETCPWLIVACQEVCEMNSSYLRVKVLEDGELTAQYFEGGPQSHIPLKATWVYQEEDARSCQVETPHGKLMIPEQFLSPEVRPQRATE